MNDRRYWFRKRDFGMGWTPISKEGWAATGLLVASLVTVTWVGANAGWGPLHLVAFSLVLVAVFIPIAISTCEP